MFDTADECFDRPKTAPLPGSVSPYGRHLLVCTGQAEWRSHIAEDGGFIQALSQAVAERASDLALQVKINACDETSRESGCDIMVFPDGVRYTGLSEDDIPTLVEEHLVGNRPAGQLSYFPLAGKHIFICVHMNRDPRCGVCGPALTGLFRRQLAVRGLDGQVAVHRTSHLGGHEYAGNVVIYPGGDWYGYVTPADVPRIIDTHILSGDLVLDRWRGRMGLTREEQIQFVRLDTAR
jgi:(2Fe-2S) ferredoxin